MPESSGRFAIFGMDNRGFISGRLYDYTTDLPALILWLQNWWYDPETTESRCIVLGSNGHGHPGSIWQSDIGILPYTQAMWPLSKQFCAEWNKQTALRHETEK